MWKSIDLNKIDDLLNDYKEFGAEGLSFSEYILKRNNKGEFKVWDMTDSVGIVTQGDFMDSYKEDYIEDNFEKLAELWFSVLNHHINDWSLVLLGVTEELPEGLIDETK